MSYSRWLDSKWYIFPSASKCIEVWRMGDEMLQWLPKESYGEFLMKASSTLTHDEKYAEDFMWMKKILEDNMDEIQKYFSEWRKEGKSS